MKLGYNYEQVNYHYVWSMTFGWIVLQKERISCLMRPSLAATDYASSKATHTTVSIALFNIQGSNNKLHK